MRKRLEATEMWFLRRMLGISWKEKKTNKEVLQSVGVAEPELLNIIKRRKMGYYGHLRRHPSLHKRIIEGKVDGKRGRGRKRQTWLANIEEMAQTKINQCCEIALIREKWKAVTANPGDGTAPR